MAIDTKHPLYTKRQQAWVECRDAYEGEAQVKSKTFVYLPATDGQNIDGAQSRAPTSPGWLAYQAYLTRSVFPDYMEIGVHKMLGLLHSRPAIIEVPDRLKALLKKATPTGDPIEHLLRRINEEQLITGRCGLLLDFDQQATLGEPELWMALYQAEAIINWDQGAKTELKRPVTNLVILNETEMQRDADFDWKEVEQYRMLVLGDPTANEASGIYQQALFSEANGGSKQFDSSKLITPSIRGRALDHIPFQFINSKDINANPDKPPYWGLARLCYTIYRGEADYRQNLFMQGQDTLVRVGYILDEEARTGAGAIIDVPQGGDAKYIGVDGKGLTEQRQALENDRLKAGQGAGELANRNTKTAESGDALQIRVAALTASLTTIALAGAAGLERTLKSAATWLGVDPDDVRVLPNLEFADEAFGTKELVEMMTAKNMGAPISNKSIHQVLQDRGWTRLSLEEELGEIEGEEPLGGSTREESDRRFELDEQAQEDAAKAAEAAAKAAKEKPNATSGGA